MRYRNGLSAIKNWRVVLRNPPSHATGILWMELEEKKNGNYTGRVYKKSRRRPIRKVKIEMSLKGNILKASSATLVLLVCFARVCQRGNSAVMNGTFLFLVNASTLHVHTQT